MTSEKAKPKKTKIKRAVRRRKPLPYVEPYVKRDPVVPEEVRLVEGTGTLEHGGGPGGHYWHIYVGDHRAGYIYINLIEDNSFGVHPSIQIFLNKTERGKQIGRVAYRLACEQSQYERIYAHMRKSNIGSMRAAEEAGFKVVQRKGLPQLSMMWRRKKSLTKDKNANIVEDI